MDTHNPRSIEPLTVPQGPAAFDRVLPAVAAALDGGPALLPLPEEPAAMRESRLAAIQPDVPLDDNGAAFVVPTSGSAGEPKGVLLSADAIRASAEATHARLGGPGRWLLALPATYIAGLMVLARSVVAGTTPVALDLTHGFDPESFAAAAVRLVGESQDRRYTALVPRQLAAILDAGDFAPEALAAFDGVLLGGSAAPPELAERARDAGVRLVTTYGMTETCGGCVYDGAPLDNVKVEVGGDDRIRLAGPVLASGYRLRPDLTADAFAHGWFITCDAGRIDEGGRLQVMGRVDDVAVTGGVNVPLSVVDAAVGDHPQVAEACTVAVPDITWGERLVTAVVTAGEAPSLPSIREHVTRTLPAAYAPKELVVLDALPRLHKGSVDRRTVAARLRQRPVS